MEQNELLEQNRRLLEAITQAKKAWEATVDAIEDPIFITDIDHKIMRGNLALFRFLNKGISDVLGQKCHRLIHNSETPPADCIINKVKEKGEPISTEIECSGLGGKFLCSAYPQVFTQGFGLVHYLRDLRTLAPEDKYRTFFEQAPLPMVSFEYDSHKIVDANVSMGRLLGYKKEELIALNFDHFLPDELRDSTRNLITKQLEGSIKEVKVWLMNREQVRIQTGLVSQVVVFGGTKLLHVILLP